MPHRQSAQPGRTVALTENGEAAPPPSTGRSGRAAILPVSWHSPDRDRLWEGHVGSARDRFSSAGRLSSGLIVPGGAVGFRGGGFSQTTVARWLARRGGCISPRCVLRTWTDQHHVLPCGGGAARRMLQLVVHPLIRLPTRIRTAGMIAVARAVSLWNLRWGSRVRRRVRGLPWRSRGHRLLRRLRAIHPAVLVGRR